MPVSGDGLAARGIGARVGLEKALREYGSAQESGGQLYKYGIYFRDFQSNATIGIHEAEDFSPASLLKLPVAMWYYKQAESDPSFLSNEINFTGPKGVNVEHFPPKRSVTVGTTYSLEQLIELMLQESDNDATNILSQYAGGPIQTNSVYEDLGITGVNDYNTYIIDVHTYAAFFSSLYKVQYLNRFYSNQLLEVMTHASFADGLAAGVPSSVPIAHKFGERVIDASKSIVQLHDCGIVYAAHPYLLCVMTQAHSYAAALAFISGISHKVFDAFGN